MKEPFELATESIGELIDTLKDVTTSLEDTLGRLGAQLGERARRDRWADVERAQALLQKLSPD